MKLFKKIMLTAIVACTISSQSKAMNLDQLPVDMMGEVLGLDSLLQKGLCDNLNIHKMSMEQKLNFLYFALPVRNSIKNFILVNRNCRHILDDHRIQAFGRNFQMILHNLQQIGSSGMTRLNQALFYIAKANKYTSLIPFLVQHGANLNIQESEFQDTPLHEAVRHFSERSVRELLAAGANKNIVNKVKETPFEVANDMRCRNHMESEANGRIIELLL